MGKELLEKVLDYGVENNLNSFFCDVTNAYSEIDDDLSAYDDDRFTGFKAIGEIIFNPNEKLVVVTAKVLSGLTERSGKKAQYEKARNILKDYMKYDAGIFVFSDSAGSFRFSLVYGQAEGTKKSWSNFRRFTYFVSKDGTNKTFYDRIGRCDFSSLDIVKDAFSVEKVTKDFYKQIADWYFWAVKNSKFPDAAENEKDGRNIAVIRLITRLIFIWFMKERKLVSPDLFDKAKMSALLKSLKPDETTYYKAILQNLFFATLNTKIEDRKFRFTSSFQGKNTDYMDHGIYRYEDYFNNREDMLAVFKDIPFLNGGLFDCLDWPAKESGTGKEVRFDGFSDNEIGLKAPNYLFFSEEREADLNKDYGTENRKYRVQGLLNILSAYNFTIDENDPNDQEVALDPELLGKVFENLLASFNPKTATIARKATGSYYTPREIVDYMVTQSLNQYYRTHLGEIDDIDSKLDELLSPVTDEAVNPFDDVDSKKVVQLTEALRIVDPAVGSGAFPMGILNKLVSVLSRVDPDNRLWQEAQLRAVDDVPDPLLKQKLVKQINEQFAEKNSNYGRKLYLIQKCIYGVDIQQIAIEIAKLRFFIALLVDKRIDRSKPNWGIEPLPNLDFKLMQGNSLISEFMGIDLDAEDSDAPARLVKDETDELISRYQNKKSEFQYEPDRKRKEALKNEIDKLIEQIFESKLKTQKAEYYTKLKNIERRYASVPDIKQRNEAIRKDTETLNTNYKFDLDQAERQLKEFTTGLKVKPFFAWKLYFAEVFHEKGGFDIVIANPPYGFRSVLSKDEKSYFRKQKGIQFPSGDSAELFMIITLKKLVRKMGSLTFIIPKKSLYGESWRNVRKIWTSNGLTFLMDASKAFEEVLLEQVSFSIVKGAPAIEVTVGALNQAENRIELFGSFPLVDIFTEDLNNAQIYRGIFPKSLLNKIKSNFAVPADGLVKGEIGISNITSHFTFEPAGNYPCVKGIDIVKYGLKPERRYLKGKIAKKYLDLYQDDKIVAQKIIAHVQNPFPHIIITMFYDNARRLINDTCVEIKVLGKKLDKRFLLAYYQSTFCNWYAYNLVYNRAIRTMDFIDYYVTQIPIPQNAVEDPNRQQPFIDLVNKILVITKDEGYLSNTTKQARVKELEHQIDQLVYELYGLTDEEIAVVEGAFKK